MNNEPQLIWKNWLLKLKNENRDLKNKLDILREQAASINRDLKSQRKIFWHNPLPAILVSQENIKFVNQAAIKLVGYSLDDLLGKNIFNLIHQDATDRIRKIYQKRISGKLVSFRHEVYLKKKSGEKCLCEVLVKDLRYQGRLAFLVNIILLEERKQKERRYTHAVKMESVNKMASSISNQENYLLKNLRLHINTLKGLEQYGDPDLGRVIMALEDDVKKASRFVKHMAVLSGSINSSNSLLDISKIVQEALLITRTRWAREQSNQKSNIRVNTFIRTNAKVKGQAEDLMEAIGHILFNAMEAIAEGGEIYVTTETHAGFVHIYIQDNGSGMDNEAQDRIFDPFFTSKSGKLDGLGLSLAHAILKSHGGSIEVLSQEGQGSAFTIRLPIEHGNPKIVSPPKTSLNGSHILLFFQDGILKDLLFQVLLNKNACVLAVDNIRDCMKLLKKKDFDLVVAKLSQSYKKSFNIIGRIKSFKESMPIILVDAQDQNDDFGADMLIYRPLEMNNFLGSISQILAKNRVNVVSN